MGLLFLGSTFLSLSLPILHWLRAWSAQPAEGLSSAIVHLTGEMEINWL